MYTTTTTLAEGARYFQGRALLHWAVAKRAWPALVPGLVYHTYMDNYHRPTVEGPFRPIDITVVLPGGMAVTVHVNANERDWRGHIADQLKWFCRRHHIRLPRPFDIVSDDDTLSLSLARASWLAIRGSTTYRVIASDTATAFVPTGKEPSLATLGLEERRSVLRNWLYNAAYTAVQEREAPSSSASESDTGSGSDDNDTSSDGGSGSGSESDTGSGSTEEAVRKILRNRHLALDMYRRHVPDATSEEAVRAVQQIEYELHGYVPNPRGQSVDIVVRAMARYTPSASWDVSARPALSDAASIARAAVEEHDRHIRQTTTRELHVGANPDYVFGISGADFDSDTEPDKQTTEWSSGEEPDVTVNADGGEDEGTTTGRTLTEFADVNLTGDAGVIEVDPADDDLVMNYKPQDHSAYGIKAGPSLAKDDMPPLEPNTDNEDDGGGADYSTRSSPFFSSASAPALQVGDMPSARPITEADLSVDVDVNDIVRPGVDLDEMGVNGLPGNAPQGAKVPVFVGMSVCGRPPPLIPMDVNAGAAANTNKKKKKKKSTSTTDKDEKKVKKVKEPKKDKVPKTKTKPKPQNDPAKKKDKVKDKDKAKVKDKDKDKKKKDKDKKKVKQKQKDKDQRKQDKRDRKDAKASSSGGAGGMSMSKMAKKIAGHLASDPSSSSSSSGQSGRQPTDVPITTSTTTNIITDPSPPPPTTAAGPSTIIINTPVPMATTSTTTAPMTTTSTTTTKVPLSVNDNPTGWRQFGNARFGTAPSRATAAQKGTTAMSVQALPHLTLPTIGAGATACDNRQLYKDIVAERVNKDYIVTLHEAYGKHNMCVHVPSTVDSFTDPEALLVHAHQTYRSQVGFNINGQIKWVMPSSASPVGLDPSKAVYDPVRNFYVL